MSSPTDHEAPFSADEFLAWKQADRAELAALPRDEAQALVESILQPRLWQIADPTELIWPGDLAEEDECE